MTQRGPADLAIEILRKAMAGDIAVKLTNPGRTWDSVFAGDCSFWFGDWEVVFFNDADEVDYVASMRRGGKFYRYQQLNGDGSPLPEFVRENELSLERLLKGAT